jgi:MoaA/NifB/PqqE/SkfB family radical SAM enzyme
MTTNLIDQQNSLVIDVTYNCNAKCHYCRWGNSKTPGRLNQPDEYIYIPVETLQHLNTERIVFSGGEPLLRQDLEQIISYYNQAGVKSIVLITNGFLITESRLSSLIASGLTGITFSIDSFESGIAFEARAYNNHQHERVKSSFIQTCLLKKNFQLEIGINVVVSSANIQNNHLEKLIDFVNDFPLDWIKFQPIFDDGYAGTNATHLLLSSSHSGLIRAVGKNILGKTKIETNPINFWESLADTLDGKKLVGNSCGLDNRQAIAQKGKVKICSWINYPTYDITKQSISETQEQFVSIKAHCKTGTFCYCLQNLSHTWETA